MTDRELLRRYADARDQEAFAQLVARHMPMVYGSARRQIGSGAEDVTQAVFFLLARRAKLLGGEGSLAAWLFQATRFCCQNFKRKEQIRKKHEREAAMREAKPADSQQMERAAPEVAEFLDAGLAGLRSSDRAAVLLRYLEGRSFEEMADDLGISVDAAKKRATRGLQRLRDYFVRYGASMTGDSLSRLITASAAVTVPSGLETSVAGLGKTAVAGAKIHGLAQGAAKMMVWAKLKLAAMAVAGITAGTAIAIAIAAAAQAQDIAPAQMASSAPTAAATAEVHALTLAPPATMPTANQLLALMEASRARYRSIDMEYSVSISEPDDKFTETDEDIWRWTRDREYYHADVVSHEDGQALTANETIMATQTWSKKFERSSENGPEGIVMRGNELMQATDSNPFKLMDSRFAQGNTPVKWDENTGFLELETRLVYGTKTGAGSFWASKDDAIEKVIVDPSRGFVPVRYQRSKADGTVMETDVFADYREVEKGLWIPWKVINNWGKSDQHQYTIKRVVVNGEIPLEKLDFEFPPEAQIDDRIINKIYTPAMAEVPEVAQMLATTQPGFAVKPGAGGIRPEAIIGVENISGNVTKVTAMPARMMLGRVLAGERIMQNLTIVPQGLKDPKLLKLAPSADWIKVTPDEGRSFVMRSRDNGASLRNPALNMTEAQIAEEIAPKWYLQYLVEITPPATMKLAALTPENPPPYIEVQAGPKEKWIRVPVLVDALPGIEVEPAAVLLESGKTQYRVSVRRNGKGAWKLKGFSTKGDDVAVQSVTPEPDGRQLLIKIAAPKLGFVQGRVLLEMDGEETPVEIALVGLINK